MTKIPKQVQAQGDAADAAMKPPGEATPAAPVAEPTPQTVDFEQKYRVLQGKYNAEVENIKKANDFLTDKMVELNATVGRLSRENEELRQTPAQALPAAAVPLDLATLLTQEEMDTLDAEGLDEKSLSVLAKMMKAILGREVGDIGKRTQNLVQDVQTIKQEAKKSANDSFYDKIAKDVPDWRVINTDDRWLVYLGQKVPGTGYTRQQFLDNATDSRDHGSIIEMFNGFKTSVGLPVTGNATPTPPKPSALERQVDPVTITPTPPVDSSQVGRIWTKAEVSQFYKDYSIGKKYTEDQAKAIDLDIQQAALEGRYQP